MSQSQFKNVGLEVFNEPSQLAQIVKLPVLLPNFQSIGKWTLRSSIILRMAHILLGKNWYFGNPNIKHSP
jgi:hypothetical protein